MTPVSVVVVPQWQGSSAAGARRLASGALRLAERIGADRRFDVPVDVEAGHDLDGVRRLDVLIRTAERVRTCLRAAEGTAVVTVGGDCGVDLAPIAAAAARHGEALAVVWLDAHGDLNTPASSPSGAFHGMVLRTLLGEGPAPLVPPPGATLHPRQVILAGTRALDPPEAALLAERRLRCLPVDALVDPEALVDAVAATGASAVYVHVDLDVLDPDVFPAVGFPEPGGLRPGQVIAAVRAIAARFALVGLGITEYQPGEADTDDPAALAELIAGLPRPRVA